MSGEIRVLLMGGAAVRVDGDIIGLQVGKHPKTTALILNLIMRRGEPIRGSRLMEAVWGEEQSANPEGALKTLISRTRASLNKYKEGLGSCIASEYGGYCWHNLPGMSVDMYEVEDLLSELEGGNAFDREKAEELLSLYVGDFLQGLHLGEEARGRTVRLHTRYMEVMHRYIDLLEDRHEHETLIRVCRKALTVDIYDEGLNLSLMRALNRLNRTNEALQQYQRAVDLYRRELGIMVPASIREYYKQIIRSNQGLDENLAGIREELEEYSKGEGAIACEYAVFRDIYKMQKRTQERYGTPVLLGLVMITGPQKDSILPPAKQEKVAQSLMEILVQSLRRGDVVTRLAPNLVGLLFPVSEFADGENIMKRVKDRFDRRYPDVNIRIRLQLDSLNSANKTE